MALLQISMSYLSLFRHFRLWIHMILINAIPCSYVALVGWTLDSWQFLHNVSTLSTFTCRYDMQSSKISLIKLPVHLMR